MKQGGNGQWASWRERADDILICFFAMALTFAFSFLIDNPRQV
jgi:hypothetical protein